MSNHLVDLKGSQLTLRKLKEDELVLLLQLLICQIGPVSLPYGRQT